MREKPEMTGVRNLRTHFTISNKYIQQHMTLLKFLDKMIKLPHTVFVYRKFHKSTQTTLEKRNKGESNLCC